MTASTLIKDAFGNIGIQSPTTNQYSFGLRKLNGILGQWSAKHLLVPYNVLENFTLSAGTASYTIGSGGTFNTARPITIDYAYIRDSNSQDHPLDVIVEPEYLQKYDKTVSARPCEIYMATEYPLAIIYLYPTPNAAETLYISSLKPITSIAAIGDTISLPDEYLLALEHELSRIMAPTYGVVPDQDFLDLAKESKDTIKTLRASRVPDIEYDIALTGRDSYDAKRG